jgi:hypothetical protein
MDLIRPVVPARPSWRSRLRRSAPYAAAATALALALSGCIKLDMDLDIASDNTIDGSIVFAVDKSLLTLGGGDPEEAFRDSLTDAPFPTEGTGGGEVRTEVYDEDGKYGSRFIFTDVPLDSFDDEDLSITREGDFFIVSGTLDTTDTGTDGTDGSGSGDSTESPAPFPSELFGGFDVSISMTFPGEVVEHTGQLEGTTVTWRPEGAEPIEISAKARATDDSGPLGLASSSSMLMYGGIALAVLVVGALLVFLLVRRRSTPAPAGVPAESIAYPAAGAAAGAVFTPDGATPAPGAVPDAVSSPVPGFEPQPTLILPDEQSTTTGVAPDVAAPEAAAPDAGPAPVVPDAPQVWTPEPVTPEVVTPEVVPPEAAAPQVWTPEPAAENPDPQTPQGPVPPA